jgi:hypothetical protein
MLGIEQVVDTKHSLMQRSGAETVDKYRNLPVDCSGLVTQVCITMARSMGIELIPGTLVLENGQMVQRVSQVNVKVLTNTANSRKLDLNEPIYSGDIISGLKRKHSIVVLGVEKNNDYCEELTCAQSSDATETVGVSVFSIERILGEPIYLGKWSEKRGAGQEVSEPYNTRFLQKNDETDGVFRLLAFE